MTESGRRFGTVAADYAERRPGYPAAAVDWALGPAPGPEVLDLGAGTGKLTEAVLARPGVRVTAVEPDPAMLAQLRTCCPAAAAVAGSAEEIPLPAASVDAVLVGQAYHWFDVGRALPEIARVLRPGGVLAVVRNDDDPTVAWVAGYHAAAGERVLAGLRNPFPDDLFPHPAFGPDERSEFTNPVPTSIDGLLATLATHSWALTSTPAERDAGMRRVRDYLESRSETSAGAFTLPLVTAVARALRR